MALLFLFLALMALLFSRAEHLSSFDTGPPKEIYEIILNLSNWPRRRYHLNAFLFLDLAAIKFSGAERL